MISVFALRVVVSFCFFSHLFLCSPVTGQTLELQQWLDSLQEGSHVVFQPGTYSGNFHIRKSIYWDATGVILDGNHQGTVLTIHSKRVSIKGLTIRNSGDILGQEDAGILAENAPFLSLKNMRLDHVLFGVILKGASDSHFENVDVTGIPLEPGRRGDGIKIWYSPRVTVNASHISNTRDFIIWYSSDCIVKNSVIQNNRYGIHYMYSPHNVVVTNLLDHNSVGVYVMYSHQVTLEDNQFMANRGPSGYGIGVKESDLFRVLKNRFVGNRVGLHVDNSPLTPPSRPEDRAMFEENDLRMNDIGVEFIGTGQGTFFHHNDFVDNWQQVSYRGARVHYADWDGNYWSDYIGIDPDRDGVGQPPYQTMGLFDAITDRNEGFRLFNFGPAVLALEFASKAVPWLRPDPQAVDKSPRMRPTFTSSGKLSDWRFVWIGFVLIGILLGMYQIGHKI